MISTDLQLALFRHLVESNRVAIDLIDALQADYADGRLQPLDADEPGPVALALLAGRKRLARLLGALGVRDFRRATRKLWRASVAIACGRVELTS